MSKIGSSLSKDEDGTALINKSVVNQISGLAKDMSRTAFDAAVTQERLNITNNGTGIWSNGEKISIFGETGTRIWFVGSSAALSHARNVLYMGKNYALANDSNVFSTTVGAPSNTVGANGDYLIDSSTSLIYSKASGVWSNGVSIFPNSGGAGSDTTAARVTDPRFLGIERIDLKAKYGMRADGSSHPLGGIFSSLAAAQAVYPNAVFATPALAQAAFPTANISNSYTWQTVEVDNAAFAQAEYDIRNNSGNAGVLGLGDNSTVILSQQLNMEDVSRVWFHGGRNTRIITGGCGTTPALRIANNNGNECHALGDIGFSPTVNPSLYSSGPGVPGVGFTVGSAMILIDNVKGAKIERVSWSGFDTPIRWGNHTFGIIFNSCAAGANNYGFNWNETAGLDSMERIVFEDGSLSNNNYGVFWRAIYGPNAQGHYYSQGGSVRISGNGIDYNIIRHIEYDNTPAPADGYFAIASMVVESNHIETSGAQSGSKLCRILNRGTMIVNNNELSELDGNCPPGYIEEGNGCATQVGPNRVNDQNIAMLYNPGVPARREVYGNFMQDAYETRVVAVRSLNTDGTYTDTLQASVANSSNAIIFDDPNPLVYGNYCDYADILCYYSTPKNLTLPTSGWPNGSSFRIWCMISPVTILCQDSTTLSIFPPNANILLTPGTCAMVRRHAQNQWLVTVSPSSSVLHKSVSPGANVTLNFDSVKRNTSTSIVLSQNCSITLGNGITGQDQIMTLDLIQAPAGGFVPSFTNVSWPNNSAPTFNTDSSKVDTIEFRAVGTDIMGIPLAMARTPKGIPPTPIVTLTPGNGANTLNSSATSVPPVIDYTIYRGTVSGAENTTPLVSGVSMPYIDANLTNGTNYFYTVTARNINGSSPQSVEVSGTPIASGAFPMTFAGNAGTVPTGLKAFTGANASSIILDGNGNLQVPVGSSGDLVAAGTIADNKLIEIDLASTTANRSFFLRLRSQNDGSCAILYMDNGLNFAELDSGGNGRNFQKVALDPSTINNFGYVANGNTIHAYINGSSFHDFTTDLTTLGYIGLAGNGGATTLISTIKVS